MTNTERTDARRSISIGTALAIGMALTTLSASVQAHGPLFSPAPETIFKGGTEITLGGHFERASGAGETEKEQEGFIELEYGLTANWQIEAELPYAHKEQNGLEADGVGDLTLGTKYQFWVRDLPGAQYKASAFLNLKLPSGDDDTTPIASPVLWWTYRHFAFRGGVEIPIAEGLNGAQPTSDYRAKVEFVYHF